MSGFAILDPVVGIIFIYFLLNIIRSSAAELWFSIRPAGWVHKKNSSDVVGKTLNYDK